ncbi:MAG: HD domain-containing protein [Balneolales bacterium]|nr:HD domain-containing protein [Balneolales bacterium]
MSTQQYSLDVPDIKLLKSFLNECYLEFPPDESHDLSHIRRVVSSAEKLLNEFPDANHRVVWLSAWLHDCVSLPKNHPDRKKASVMAANRAVGWLKGFSGLKQPELDAIHHCISAHSFSAGILAETTEARIVCDADRLDALGAVGIARCISTGISFGAQLYNPESPDPEANRRQPDDKRYIADHFYTKLLKLPDTMYTEAGKAEARRRTIIMRDWLRQLYKETGV